MLDSDNNLADVLGTLSKFWLSQSIVPSALDLQYVRAISQANGVKLPPDFEQFYCLLNGMPDVFPHDMDSEGYAFWQIERLSAVQKEWVIITQETATIESVAATVFADYLISCWEFGFIADSIGDGYRIGIMAFGNEFKVISTSLAGFLKLYMKDADVLYDWKNPFRS